MCAVRVTLNATGTPRLSAPDILNLVPHQPTTTPPGNSSGPITTRLLVVDDDRALARALEINLRAYHYEVSVAHTGRAALDQFAHFHPQVVILDLGLPDLDGLEVLAGIRYGEVPVIVLSARSTSVEKVAALDAGADDYITKPFAMDELLARLRVAIRRRPSADRGSPTVITTPDFVIDLAARRVLREQQEVHLTPTEWAMLELLVQRPGQLISGAQLLAEVWGPSYAGQTNYLRVYMAQLRRKLEPNPAQPRYLITAPGAGYRFDPAA